VTSDDMYSLLAELSQLVENAELRVQALKELLIENGLLCPDQFEKKFAGLEDRRLTEMESELRRVAAQRLPTIGVGSKQ
jgi:hypothetical protein